MISFCIMSFHSPSVTAVIGKRSAFPPFSSVLFSSKFITDSSSIDSSFVSSKLSRINIWSSDSSFDTVSVDWLFSSFSSSNTADELYSCSSSRSWFSTLFSLSSSAPTDIANCGIELVTIKAAIIIDTNFLKLPPLLRIIMLSPF